MTFHRQFSHRGQKPFFRPVPRQWLWLVMLIGLCLDRGACLAEEPVRIGVSLGLTGPFSVMSQALHRGFFLWQQDVNAKGGILGRPVEVMVRDDRGDPDQARQWYSHFLEKEKVRFLFAPYSSLLTEAVLPIAARHRVPILIAGAAADRLWEKGFDNAIGIYTPASQFTRGFMELLVRSGIDGIGIVHADDPFSLEVAVSSEGWARRFELNVTMVQAFRKGSADLAPLAEAARQKGVQVLMVCGHMEEAENMARALSRIQWRPRAVYASVGPALQSFYDRCGIDAEGIFSTSLWEPRANYPGAQQFEKDFIQTFGEVPGYHAGLAYAAGEVLKEAVQETGSLDPQAVRDTLFRLDTMTLIGRFGVDATGKQVRQHTFLIQWQKGRKEVVWPQEIKTADPVFR